MELVILGVFFAFFLLFLYISFRLDDPRMTIGFLIICAVLCLIFGVTMINEGIDITTCVSDSQNTDIICETINYDDIYINGLGTIFLALTLFFIGVSALGIKEYRERIRDGGL